MINLIPVQAVEKRADILYQLLNERTPDKSISHKEMPSFKDHVRFVDSKPYLAWYFIQNEDGIAGSIYLSKQREIGVSIFKDYQRQGCAKAAIKILANRYPGRFLANVNPKNEASKRLFESLGFKHIQETYEALDNS